MNETRTLTPRTLILAALFVAVSLGVWINLHGRELFRGSEESMVSYTLPWFFSEDEVAAFITNGVTVAELESKFGKPQSVKTRSYGGVFYRWSAPRKGVPKDHNKVFVGFGVKTTNGVVSAWGPDHAYSSPQAWREDMQASDEDWGEMKQHNNSNHGIAEEFGEP